MIRVLNLSALLDRWRLILRHLACNAMTGMGFVSIMLGFLLQENDGAFVVYCVALGILLSAGNHKMSVKFQPIDATLILFGLLLIISTDDPFTHSVFFKQFLLPIASALIVASWVRCQMVSSPEDYAKKTTEKPGNLSMNRIRHSGGFVPIN